MKFSTSRTQLQLNRVRSPQHFARLSALTPGSRQFAGSTCAKTAGATQSAHQYVSELKSSGILALRLATRYHGCLFCLDVPTMSLHPGCEVVQSVHVLILLIRKTSLEQHEADTLRAGFFCALSAIIWSKHGSHVRIVQYTDSGARWPWKHCSIANNQEDLPAKIRSSEKPSTSWAQAIASGWKPQRSSQTGTA